MRGISCLAAKPVSFSRRTLLHGVSKDWMELAQDRDRKRALVSTLMNLRVPKCGEFLV